MLLDVLVQSVNEFQVDFRQLCDKHYPAIHNQGMTEHHLGLALARRMARTLIEFGHGCDYQPLDINRNGDKAPHYRVTSDIGTVWVITHHFVNASQTYRNQILKKIAIWREEYGYAIQPNDLLLLVSDHWINRQTHSRNLIHWWMGSLPDHIEDYLSQGITLKECDSQLTQSLDEYFQASPCFIKYSHPLLRNRDNLSFKKYVHLYAVLQWA
ncbi:hypothetical protein OAP63_12045 [Vibrio sp.]|nr:hypothetical protein [Vibrio sp.]